jgi:hypothetical protein
MVPCSISSGVLNSAACKCGESRFSFSGLMPICFLIDSEASQLCPSSIRRAKSLTPADDAHLFRIGDACLDGPARAIDDVIIGKTAPILVRSEEPGPSGEIETSSTCGRDAKSSIDGATAARQLTPGRIPTASARAHSLFTYSVSLRQWATPIPSIDHSNPRSARSVELNIIRGMPQLAEQGVPRGAASPHRA